jgi:hypothetical protein
MRRQDDSNQFYRARSAGGMRQTLLTKWILLIGGFTFQAQSAAFATFSGNADQLPLNPKCTPPYNAGMVRPRKGSDRHTQKTVSFRLPGHLMEQLRTLARRNRRTLSGEAQMAFEQHLSAHGLWSADDDGVAGDGKKSP